MSADSLTLCALEWIQFRHGFGAF